MSPFTRFWIGIILLTIFIVTLFSHRLYQQQQLIAVLVNMGETQIKINKNLLERVGRLEKLFYENR